MPTAWYRASDTSLSARRAWIEIGKLLPAGILRRVALRKESVDRNTENAVLFLMTAGSLSARRAWIEMALLLPLLVVVWCRSPQGERG